MVRWNAPLFQKNCIAFLLRELHPENENRNVLHKRGVKLKIDNNYRRVNSQLPALSVLQLAFLLSDRKGKKSFLHFIEA